MEQEAVFGLPCAMRNVNIRFLMVLFLLVRRELSVKEADKLCTLHTCSCVYSLKCPSLRLRLCVSLRNVKVVLKEITENYMPAES